MRALRSCVGLLALAWCVSACGASHSDSNSNTNWLRQCTGQRDCSSEQVCACGVCTVACLNSESCRMTGGPAAHCISVDAAMCAGGDVETGSVCAAECERDKDCTGDLSCVRGSCLLVQSLAQVDAGQLDAGQVEPDDAGGVLRMDAATTAPVRPPPPVVVPEPVDAGSTQQTQGCSGVECASGSACWRSACLPLWTGAGCEAAAAQRPACTSGAECAPGLVCHIDGTCIEPGTCDRFGRTTLAQGDFRDLALGADDVFALEYGTEDSLGNHQRDGAIVRVPIAGGQAQTVVMGLEQPSAIELDPDRVIWSSRAGGTNELWAASRADGSDPTRLAMTTEMNGISGFAWVHDLANVYLQANESAGVLELYRVAKNTGVTEVMTDGDWSDTTGIALDGEHVYFGTAAGLLPIPLAGGPVGELIGVGYVFQVSRDYILSSNHREMTISTIAKADRRVTRIATIVGGVEASAMQVHREHVYYKVNDGMTDSTPLWRAPLVPGEAELLTPVSNGSGPLLPFVVSDRGLFWSSEQRLLRQVIDVGAPASAQGTAGGPCFGDLSCDSGLSCVNFECE